MSKVLSDLGRKRAIALQIIFASAFFLLFITGGIYLIFSDVLPVDSEAAPTINIEGRS